MRYHKKQRRKRKSEEDAGDNQSRNDLTDMPHKMTQLAQEGQIILNPLLSLDIVHASGEHSRTHSLVMVVLMQ